MDKDSGSAAEHKNSLSASSLMDTSPETQIQNRGHVARRSDNQRQIAYDWLAKWEPINIWLVLTGIVATAAIFVLYGLTRSPVTYIDDDVFYAEPARMLASSGSLSSPMFFDIAGLNHHFFLEPPVYFLLMAGVYRVFGFSETMTRLGSAIPYIAAIVAGFFLARSLANRVGLGRLLSSVAGLLAAFLLAFNEMSRSMSPSAPGVALARSGRSDCLAVLLLFLGWLCVSKVAHAPTHKIIWASAGFVLLLLATLTHLALSGPAAGIIVAVIFCSARLGISRRTALVAALASAGLVLLPYGVWILAHFGEWRSQWSANNFSSNFFVQGSLFGNPLSAHVVNVGEVAKYAPAIVAVILLGLAVFPWRLSPDAAGALIGASAVAAASTEDYMKFLLLISFIPAVAGIILLSAKVRKSYRQLTVALVLLALLNGFAWPVFSAYQIHRFYRQSDPMLVTKNIERFVPHGAHLMGTPGVYFAAISDKAEFREFQVLYAARWSTTANLQGQFRRAVEQYKPTWFALPPGMQPGREYCYLPDRFRRVSAFNEEVFYRGIPGLAYVLWTTTSPGASPECRT